ncbi:MAG TPA: hypothetical protein VLL03_03680 [Burkholderiales bacterium]|nr:hypothetical protein [Burkholderiales bacterium]
MDCRRLNLIALFAPGKAKPLAADITPDASEIFIPVPDIKAGRLSRLQTQH